MKPTPPIPAAPYPARVAMPVDLEPLQLLTRIAAHSNISAAARELNLTPSVATRKLAALERSLNVRMFERTTRSVKLTEPGRLAVEWAHQTLASAEQLVDNMTAVVEQPSGTVRLAVNHYAERVYLPGLLERFCRKHPGIRLAITITDSIVHMIDDGYDVAIHSGSLPDGSVIGVRVREFRRVICAAPEYLKRRGTPAHPHELAGHDCLVHSAKESANWFFRKGRRLVAQPIRSYIEANTNMLLVELAGHGLGLVRMGYDVVKDDLASGRLVEVMTGYRSVYSNGEEPSLWIIYPSRHVLYRTRVLIDFLTAELDVDADRKLTHS